MDNYRELKIRCDPGFGHLLYDNPRKNTASFRHAQIFKAFLRNFQCKNLWFSTNPIFLKLFEHESHEYLVA